jgi:hypothetical protein
MYVRRCPTLPQGPPCSTIGAASLSFRVRNVSGRFPRAMAAETLGPNTRVGWLVVSVVPTVFHHPGSGLGAVAGGGVGCFCVEFVGVPSVGNHRVDASNLGHAHGLYVNEHIRVGVVIVKLSAY